MFIFKLTTKKLLWVFTTICSVLFVVFMFSDEPLEQGLNEIIDDYNTRFSTEENGTVYRLGMWASFDDNPYDIGLKIVNEAERNNGYLTEDVYDTSYSEDKWLDDISVVESTSPLFCDFRKPGCLDYIWENSEQIGPLMEVYQNYIQRYEKLMSYQTFLPVTKPSFFEPVKISELDTLSAHLIWLNAIAQFKQNNIQVAVEGLTSFITFNRGQIVSTKKLMPKVFSTIHYRLTLQVASYLLAKTEASQKNRWKVLLDSIRPFSDEELSMKNQYLHEVVAFANDLNAISEKQLEGLGMDLLNELLINLMYKPNKTLNMYYRYMKNGFNSVYYENNLIKEREIKQSGQEILTTQINNYIGSKLVYIASPRYLNIESDLHEINVEQELIHTIYGARNYDAQSVNEILKELQSPFTGKRAFLEGNQLCLEAAEGSKSSLCVYLR